MDIKISLPLLPLRDIVVFPSMVIPLFVGRDKSYNLAQYGSKFGSSLSIIVDCHQTRRERTGITHQMEQY